MNLGFSCITLSPLINMHGVGHYYYFQTLIWISGTKYIGPAFWGSGSYYSLFLCSVSAFFPSRTRGKLTLIIDRGCPTNCWKPLAPNLTHVFSDRLTFFHPTTNRIAIFISFTPSNQSRPKWSKQIIYHFSPLLSCWPWTFSSQK